MPFVKSTVHFNIATPVDPEELPGARSRSVTPGTHHRIVKLEARLDAMKQEHQEEIKLREDELVRREERYLKEMIEMKEQVTRALSQLLEQQRSPQQLTDTLSRSSMGQAALTLTRYRETLSTSIASSSSAMNASSDYVLITRRTAPPAGTAGTAAVTPPPPDTAFEDAESVTSREFDKLTGDGE
jgi:hypothetical protein